MKEDVGAYAGGGGGADATSDWSKMRVVEVREGRNFQYEGKTIAELSTDEKNGISHRGQAARKALALLESMLKAGI
jgi:hypothetical protein